MIRRSPAERYIRYLLLDNLGRSDTDVRDLVRNMGLDPLTTRYIQQVRSTVERDMPAPFHPRRRTHAESLRFTRSLEVYDLFLPDQDTITAFEILDSAPLKLFIEFALLLHAPFSATAEQLVRQFNFRQATETAVRKYHQFFFDLTFIDASESRALLDARFAHDLDSQDPETKKLAASIYRSRFSDPRWVATKLPHNAASVMLAQTRIGIMPPDYDEGALLHDLRKLVMLRMYETVSVAGPDYDRVYLNLQTGLRMTVEMQVANMKPEESLRSQMEKVRLKPETSAVPVIHQLTGGHHTTDLVSAPVSKETSET